MLPTLLAALTIGLFSTLHCVGMCGGIMGALAFSVPEPVRQRRTLLFAYLLAYNFGRIGSYAAAGALFATLGAGLYGLLSPADSHRFLQIVAGAVLAGMGLYLAGLFPRFAQLERLGVPIWRRLEPIGRRLLPVRSPAQALFYGAVWGWLPCGLVYSSLLLTITLPGPTEGALFMTAFGVGTLPAVMGVGILADKLRRLSRLPHLRRIAGMTLVLLGLAGVLFADELHRFLPHGSEQQPIQCIQ